MQLCLGTVQFGMDYGICNQKKPSEADAVAMLEYAAHHGIDTFDTAWAYGSAEDVVGKFLQTTDQKRESLTIISKLRPNILDEVCPSQYVKVMNEQLHISLKRLHTDYLDVYLLHSARYIFNDEITESLAQLKKDGLVKKVGVSVYEPYEAKRCIENANVDFMQLPYSIFDQRMKEEGVFALYDEKKIQIHSRSAFIQGLILMSEEQVPPFLQKAKPIVRKIDELCNRYRVSRIELAMGYVKRQEAISHLVFGVDSIEQLKENIDVFENTLDDELVDSIAKEFAGIEADIVMPSLWKK